MFVAPRKITILNNPSTNSAIYPPQHNLTSPSSTLKWPFVRMDRAAFPCELIPYLGLRHGGNFTKRGGAIQLNLHNLPRYKDCAGNRKSPNYIISEYSISRYLIYRPFINPEVLKLVMGIPAPTVSNRNSKFGFSRW